MNTINESPPQLTSEAAAERPLDESKISGFDGGTRSIWRQSSFFLSVALTIVAMAACFGNSPVIFCTTTAVLIGLAVILHLVADKCLTRVNNNLDVFSLPFEGMFVVTFGSILPGLGLLAYGLYALCNSAHMNILEELGKLVLLVVVPIFNFSVWSAIRRRYLIRPRLTGMMNGFAVGLAASWTVIFLKSVLVSHCSDTKFGWMLLLCLSPALLFSAVCLSVDLHRKTEANISRIATTFSALGCLLSVLIVFAPMSKAFYVQSLIKDALRATPTEQPKLIETIQAQANPEDLRPTKFPVSGLNMSSLLLGSRGLEDAGNNERNMYFKITGKPFDEPDPGAGENKSEDADLSAANAAVGSKIVGLSLTKSQIFGKIDASTLTSAVDWSMTFHNASADQQEANSVLSLPENSVVSRVTLWVNGEAQEAAFASPAKTQAAYDDVTRRSRDPLLVTMLDQNKILVQCFPVAGRGGDMKIRIGFKLGLKTDDGKTCTLELPRLLATNYSQPRRRQLQFTSTALFGDSIAGGTVSKTSTGYALTASLKDGKAASRKSESISIIRGTNFKPVAVLDETAKTPQYIVEQLQHVVKTAPKKLFVVVDSSKSMRGHTHEICRDIAAISTFLRPLVYFGNAQVNSKGETAIAPPMSELQAQTAIIDSACSGGQDNRLALQEALELASDTKDCAVLWIHGPQPVSQNLSDLPTLDLVHPVHLYDFQLEAGPNEILQTLAVQDPSRLVKCETISANSNIPTVSELVSSWKNPENRLTLKLIASQTDPGIEISKDQSVAIQVARLWAKDRVYQLMASGNEHEAITLAQKYRIISPVSGAVVLGEPADYKKYHLDSGAYKDIAGGAPTTLAFRTYTAPSGGAGGLIGMPVDPRYGQSNEYGRMSDFGYDTMRDTSRLVTGISGFIALLFAINTLRSKKSKSGGAYAQAALMALAVPLLVHLLGTHFINNFGGLGGGL